MKREKISIKWKIFTYFLILAGILLILLWVFQIVYLDAFYRQIKANEAKEASSKVVTLLNESESDEEAEDQIDLIASQSNLTIMVCDLNGNSLYTKDYLMNSNLKNIPKNTFDEFVYQAQQAGGSTSIVLDNGDFMIKKDDQNAIPQTEGGQISSDMQDDAMLDDRAKIQLKTQSIIYISLVEANGQNVVVLLHSQLSPVDATVNTLRVQLLYVTVIMIGLALLIALLLSKSVSKSIIKINESAKDLAKGNFDVKFEGKDYREIAQLSDTLNYTARELGKSENFRRELIANVSHDLRTPLTMIKGYSEVMRDLPGENTPENVQVIIDETQRLTNLVNDMLDISKLQAGVLEMNALEFNLTNKINSVFERYNKLKENEGYQIEFISDRQVYVIADEYKIYQVIYNLVNNAINYTGEDKKVIVRQVVMGENVRIEVRDSGEGIPKEALPYVWDRYYKVDKTHKRAVMGTGLGLSIVKNILNLHNASYGVDSRLNEGSTFWFELKISKAEPILGDVK